MDDCIYLSSVDVLDEYTERVRMNAVDVDSTAFTLGET